MLSQTNLLKCIAFVLISTFLHQTIAAQCVGRRPLITSFTNPQQIQLRDLMIAYLGSDPNIVGKHNINPGNFHNREEEFLTWHRVYIQEMEQYLLANGGSQFVPLPKWDPETHLIPSPFTGTAGVLTGFSPIGDDTPGGSPSETQYSFTQFVNFPGICGNFPAGNYSTVCDGFHANGSTLDHYAGDLECEHNRVHGAIGGSMGSVATAPATTIFWLWHAYVDDLYYCFQESCMSLSEDLWSADDANDVGAEPYPKSVMWTSDDIWVRNQNDGFSNQTHQDPEHVSGSPVFVYVKVRNSGGIPNADGIGNIHLYWAKASTALSWPDPWTGNFTFTCDPTLVAGGEITPAQPLRAINEDYVDVFDINLNSNTTETLSDFTIYEFAWFPPNPDDYIPCVPQIGNGSHNHFCLLARTITPNEPLSETSALGNNVNNNDQIVWKNISLLNDTPGIIGGEPGGGVIGAAECVFIGNYDKEPVRNTSLTVAFPTQKDAKLLDLAAVGLILSPNVMAQVKRTPRGMTPLPNGVGFQILTNGAQIPELTFNEFETDAACIQVVPFQGATGTFEFDLIQANQGKTVGGERYVATLRGDKVKFRSSASEDMGLTASKISIMPNPTSDIVTITSLDVEQVKSVQIFSPDGKLVKKYQFENTLEIDLSDRAKGVYIVKVKNLQTGKITTEKLVVN